MKEIRHLKTMKNKRNLNTKWLLLQNDQNADTTLLHSHDDLFYVKIHVNVKKQIVKRQKKKKKKKEEKKKECGKAHFTSK